MIFDIFNGDADGLCALHQYRLAYPAHSSLIAGTKRDIQLLSKLEASATDQLYVFDISWKENHQRARHLLDQGTQITWFDHHIPGQLPQHPHLASHICTEKTTCTSLIVNEVLQSPNPLWAAVGAYGDNMTARADQLLTHHHLNSEQRRQLQQLGQLMNYNAYGESIDDLHIPPVALYHAIAPYKSPFDFIHTSHEFQQLAHGYDDDQQHADQLSAYFESPHCRVFVLANQTWARRLSGTLANQLANQCPHKAHAVLTPRTQSDHYIVSVRAPLATRLGANALCSQFETGGGREAAAGINYLPTTALEHFIEQFKQHFNAA